MSLRFATWLAPRLLMVSFLVTAGCQREAPKKAVGPSPISKQNSETVSGIPFHLVPLRWEGKETRLPPTELIDKLFASLNDDATAKQLLSKLHGGAEVTFLARKLTEAELEKIAPPALPATGESLFWAITKWTPAPIDDETEKIAPGRQLHMPVYLAWTYRTRLERDLPYPIPVLVAVINDHLLRHNLGYQLKHGRVPPVLEPMPGDRRPIAEIRAELNENIQKLVSNVDPGK